MRKRQAAALIVAGILVLAGCSGQGNLTGGGGGAGATTGTGGAGGGGGGGATAGPSGTPSLPGGPGPNASGGAGGPGAPGTITGSFTFRASKHSEDPTIQGVIDDTIDATINVQLKRDAAAPGEAYVDNGSSYTVTTSTKTSRLLGTCTATSETTGDGAYAFADQPTSTPNDITATVDRGAKSMLMFASFSWTTSVTANACDGRQPFHGENASTVACPFFGLTVPLIEDNGFDRIDISCQLAGGETYSGSLRLTR